VEGGSKALSWCAIDVNVGVEKASRSTSRAGEYSCLAMYRLVRNVRVLLRRGSIHTRVLVERRWKERKRFLLAMCFGLGGRGAG
jgi:hypothetical protein